MARKYYGLTLFMAVVMALAVMISGCGAPDEVPEAPPELVDRNIAVLLDTEEIVVFWDPSETWSNEVIAFQNVYETLLRYDPFADTFEPILATDYSVSEDGLTWTFELREGVVFHTGNPFNAEAVKYSIDRTMELGMGASFIWAAVEEINVLDEFSVEFVLAYPSPIDLIASAAYAAYIFDPVVTEEKGSDWFYEGNAAGTGPYMVESWTPMDELVLTRFDDYWGGWEQEGHFEKAVLKVVQEPSTARHMLEAGEADWASLLPFELITALEADPDIMVTTTPSFQNLLGLFNTEKAPLDDAAVRQALSYAFPYDSVIEFVMMGYASQGRGPIPKGLWGHSEELYQYSHDLDRAADLLAQAGYPDGGFELLLTYASGNEIQRRIGELYKAELAGLGIDLELRGMPWESQWDMAKAPNPEARQDIFVFYWWPDAPDPISWLWSLYYTEEEIGFNLSYFSDPRYDDLIDEASVLAGIDRDQAIELYGQAQAIVIEEAASLFIYDQEYVRVMRTNFKGYRDNPVYPNVVFLYDCYRE